MRLLETLWYQPRSERDWLWLLWLALVPLSVLYAIVVMARRAAYSAGLRGVEKLSVPVIVVGNITAGGTGKTPLVIWLAEHLRSRGHRPGVVTRGYRGRATEWPQAVTAVSDPGLVGDEAVLIAQRTGCPVVAAPSRVAAARTLLASRDVTIVVSDDGLQHYALARDLEMAVVDSARGSGNGWLLPAGPLREPASRLSTVDVVVRNGLAEQGMTLAVREVCRLDGAATRKLEEFKGMRVHAVAGIGNPQRFFATLRSYGIEAIEHTFPDHYEFAPGDVLFEGADAVLMTEKDAVKCRRFAGPHHWLVRVDGVISPLLLKEIDQALSKVLKHG